MMLQLQLQALNFAFAIDCNRWQRLWWSSLNSNFFFLLKERRWRQVQKVCCAGEAEGWQLQEDAINVSLQGGHSHQRISYHPHAHCFRHLTTVHGYLKLVKQNNRTPCFFLQNSSSTDCFMFYPTPFSSLMIGIVLLPRSRPDLTLGETLWH